MSAYSGRTGPNFSQFLNTLNTIQPNYEQEILSAEDVNLDQELAMFTNADFTDFDAIGGMPNNQQMNFAMNQEQQQGVDNGVDIKYEELLSSEPNPFLSNYGGPIQPSPQQPAYQQAPRNISSSGSSASPQMATVKPGQKRKSDVDVSNLSMEEQTRLAAEEDKRRRNTAASARFRVKKKQREQALEKRVKEVTDKNSQLQVKVEQLEMENKWLKNLITEKTGNQTEKEISDLYQKFRRESEECEPSRSTEHKDGVGTE